jgi:cellulose synthase/poly-beta-1,6-N-acetylglucosamine synthase-like glycosyltransferase
MPLTGSSKARWSAPLLATPCDSQLVSRAVTGSDPHFPGMFELAVGLVASPLVVGLYAYVGYPAILWAITRIRNRAPGCNRHWTWPSVTVTVPVYNAGSSIRATLQALTDVDYPHDRLQILVLSDASTDGTDDIVREFAPKGVELLRSPERRGKTAAENLAVSIARGEIIVNVDATIGVPPSSLKLLVGAFIDPTVGVASGRDISVDSFLPVRETNVDSPPALGPGGEARYTSYEMWLRDLETQAGSIVGASGCFFAIRRGIHDEPLPPELSWDFASTLIAKKKGYRSVSVPNALCVVPRTAEIRAELRRKSRTMARGLCTLFHFRGLMNPFRYGGFALMLISHKLLRWVPYLLAPVAIVALGWLSTQSRIAALALVLVAAGALGGLSAIRTRGGIAWRPIALAGFVVAAITAGFLAWYDALRGARMITWSPTPRPNVSTV